MVGEEKTESEKENISENQETPESNPETPEVTPKVESTEEKGESVLSNPTEEPVNLGDDPIQTVTIFDTPQGTISVVHDITLGDLIISTILMAFLIFYVLNQLIRRF